jgi:hypothetical protein
MKPRLGHIPPLLIAGAALSLAVAWLCAAWLTIGGSRLSTISGSGSVQRAVVTDRWLGVSRINAATFSELTLDSTGSILIARWAGDGSERGEILAGWPLRAFKCTNYGAIQISLGASQIGMNKSGLNPIEGGIELSPDAATGAWRALPYKPLWLGLFIDTVFWTMIAWFLLGGAIHLKKRRRRLHGLCIACGYNISGAVHEACPECGAAISCAFRIDDGVADAVQTTPTARAG